MLQPSFSKAAIRGVEFLITKDIARFLAKLRVAAIEKTPVNLTRGFQCLTGDIVMNYAFQENLGGIDAPNFELPLLLAQDNLLPLLMQIQYFPTIMHPLLRQVNRLPLKFTERFMPGLAAYRLLSRVRHLGCINTWRANNDSYKQCEKRIQTLKSEPKNDSIPTIFDIALNPDPKKGQFTPNDEELTADARGMFTAGTHTTANALTYATWHVLKNPEIERKLVAELRHAMPDQHVRTDWQTLETLPYLVGLVHIPGARSLS